jgi:pimeloyl-ACP methyl ester carboxylesterase
VRALVTWAGIAHADRFGEAAREAWRRGEAHPVINARTGQTFLLRPDYLIDLEAHRTRYDFVARAAAVGCPWLLVHGAADETVPPLEGDRLYRAAGGDGAGERLRLLLVPGAGHTFGASHPFARAPAALEAVLAETIAWFRVAFTHS